MTEKAFATYRAVTAILGAVFLAGGIGAIYAPAGFIAGGALLLVAAWRAEA